MGDLIQLPARRTRRSSGQVRRKQSISGQLLPFPSGRVDHRRPSVLGDSPPLLPLADRPMTFTNVIGHLGDGVPDLKDIRQSIHNLDSVSDNSSGQVRAINPMTGRKSARTIRPMGRGTTPARFRAELAEKLRAARIVAKYETQLQAAQALGVGLDRYRKWESGRTPIPAQYVPAVCELFNIDANYLFSVEAKAIRKMA